MSDFKFEIEGDASKADRAIDTVLTRLEAIKRQAQQASLTPGIDKMAAGFARLGEAIRKEQAALSRTTQLHQQLTAAANPAALAFGKMAEAIQREQQMLERLHGPARQHAQDLQTLDALMKKGAISAREYAMATSRASSVGSYKVAKVGMPGMGGMGGLAATAGAVVGGGAAFGALDDYQNMQNRLRYLAGGDVQKVNELFKQLQGVSERTRQSLGATTETFVKVSMSTKQMGMSTGQTMQFMERLNKAVALSGASSSAASAGLLQLSQAMSAGVLRGEEYNSIIEQIPVVADTIQKSLGVTRGELRKMANEGAITSEMIVTAFQKAGTSLDKDFGNTLPTVGQHWTMFKDKIALAIGEMNEAIDIAGKLGSALGYIGDSLSKSSLESGKGAVFDVTNVLTFGQAARNLEERVTRTANESVKLLDVMSEIKSSTDEWGYAVTAAAPSTEKWTFALGDLSTSAKESAADILAMGEAIDQFQKIASTGSTWFVTLDATNARANEIARERTNAVTKAKDELASLEIAYRNGGTTEALYNQQKKALLATINGTVNATRNESSALNELARIREALLGTESRSAQAIREAAQARAEFAADVQRATQAEIDAENRAAEQGRSSMEARINAHQEWIELRKKGADEWRTKQQEIADAAKQAAAESARAWGQGLGEIGSSFIDAAREGQQSFSEMTQNMLRDIAMLILKMAALKAIKNAVASRSIGGGTGELLTGLVGGFAHGGVIHEGNGGTDSQLVAFRKSPNERVTIETPEQQRTGALRSGGSGGITVVNQYQDDPRAIRESLNGRDGDRVIYNSMRRLGRGFN